MDLAGLTVVVTRAKAQAKRLAHLLGEEGAVPLVLPTIKIENPSDWAAADQAARDLSAGRYAWVLFTSANGVEKFCERLGAPAERLTGTKVAAVGRSTASLLTERGVGVDLIAASYTGVDLAKELGAGDGEVLLPRAEVVPPHMGEVLRGNGWTPHDVAVYRTVPADPSGPEAQQVRDAGFDIVTFTSASTVTGFAGMVGDVNALGLGSAGSPKRLVACIGPLSAEACSAAGMRVDVQAAEHTVEGLVRALKEAEVKGWDDRGHG